MALLWQRVDLFGQVEEEVAVAGILCVESNPTAGIWNIWTHRLIVDWPYRSLEYSTLSVLKLINRGDY